MATTSETTSPFRLSDAQSELLFERVAAGENLAIVQLYFLIGRTVRARLVREFGELCDDLHHDVFLSIVTAIKCNAIRRPGSILGYICAVIRFRQLDLINSKIRARDMPGVIEERSCPAARADKAIELAERDAIVKTALARLPPLQREVAQRFYYEEQTRDAVIEGMGITETQYRLAKSRAIANVRQHIEKMNARKAGAFHPNAEEGSTPQKRLHEGQA